jgi:hypothetical protein
MSFLYAGAFGVWSICYGKGTTLVRLRTWGRWGQCRYVPASLSVGDDTVFRTAEIFLGDIFCFCVDPMVVCRKTGSVAHSLDVVLCNAHGLVLGVFGQRDLSAAKVVAKDRRADT